MLLLSNTQEYIKAKLVHSVHTSQRRSFRGCRRRHNWVFVDGYYPYVTVKPLEFGVAFHKAMEKLYDPITWDNKELAYQLARAIFVQTCEGQFAAYKQAVKDGKVYTFVDMTEVEADYQERKELGLGMLLHYFKHEMHHDKDLRPVKVETEFEVVVVGPDGKQLWCKCDRCWKRWNAYAFKNTEVPEVRRQYDHVGSISRFEISWDYWEGLPVTYGGRFDALMIDQLGRYWIVDWKTAARMSTGEPGADDDYMWLDDQITSYCWAMWSIGFPIAGFIYAELKKVAPIEPEPLSRPYKGRLYSTNKQAITSTHSMYKTTVQENDPIAFHNGLYDEFLQHLKDNARFHLRHEIHRNEHELQEAGFNIWQEACDIIDPNLKVYPSAGRWTCNGCAFKEPCLGMNRGEDYQYYLDTMYEKRERHYFERPPSTDKPGRD